MLMIIIMISVIMMMISNISARILELSAPANHTQLRWWEDSANYEWVVHMCVWVRVRVCVCVYLKRLLFRYLADASRRRPVAVASTNCSAATSDKCCKVPQTKHSPTHTHTARAGLDTKSWSLAATWTAQSQVWSADKSVAHDVHFSKTAVLYLAVSCCCFCCCQCIFRFALYLI